MKTFARAFMILAATTAVIVPSADAQRPGPDARRQAMGARTGGVEAVMRLRDRLELTEDQIQRLDAVRRDVVARRGAEQAEMAEIRSRVAAGQADREELRTLMQERRAAAEAARTQVQERVQGILTDAQRDEIERLRGQARAFRMGRASAMRGGGRGFQGGRGFRGPGMRPQRGGAWGGRGFRDGVRGGPDGWGFRDRPGVRRGLRGGPGDDVE